VTETFERTELLAPEPAQALGGLLGVPVPDLSREGLPLLWHWIYLLDRAPQADLGRDGHPVRGTVLAPPKAGQRRMWAGGRVRAHGPLRCGEPATKIAKILSVQEKQGRSGPLTFVTVSYRIIQRDRLVVDEEQDIVYREPVVAAPAGKSTEREAREDTVPPAEDEWAIDTTPALLFRFSALTYNSHRIHYDRDYAREVEGYPGLITHGPLQAVAMAEAARAKGRTGAAFFEYRLIAPLFDFQGMVVRAIQEGEETVTTVRDRGGRQTAKGTLRTRERSQDR
jgi:3-methylfumaryl-CoA hydratase